MLFRAGDHVLITVKKRQGGAANAGKEVNQKDAWNGVHTDNPGIFLIQIHRNVHCISMNEYRKLLPVNMLTIIGWTFLNRTVFLKKGGISLTNAEMEQMTDKIYGRTKNYPGVDRELIKKCLQGIALLGDPQVEARLKHLIMFL